MLITVPLASRTLSREVRRSHRDRRAVLLTALSKFTPKRREKQCQARGRRREPSLAGLASLLGQRADQVGHEAPGRSGCILAACPPMCRSQTELLTFLLAPRQRAHQKNGASAEEHKRWRGANQLLPVQPLEQASLALLLTPALSKDLSLFGGIKKKHSWWFFFSLDNKSF